MRAGALDDEKSQLERVLLSALKPLLGDYSCCSGTAVDHGQLSQGWGKDQAALRACNYLAVLPESQLWTEPAQHKTLS